MHGSFSLFLALKHKLNLLHSSKVNLSHIDHLILLKGFFRFDHLPDSNLRMWVAANLVGYSGFADAVAVGVNLHCNHSSIRCEGLFFGDSVNDGDLSVVCLVESDQVLDLLPAEHLDVVSVGIIV